MIRSLAILALACFLLGATAVCAGDCVVCPNPAEDSLITLINDYRQAGGIGPLEVDRRLFCSARRHAADLVRHDFLSFTGTDGSSPEQRRSEAGYFSTGESNVVVNSGGAGETFALLVGAPGVVEHFLDPGFRHIGVGYYTDQAGDATSAWSLDYGSGVDSPVEPTCRTIYCPTGADMALLTRINSLRADNGLPVFEADDRLVESAQIQACEMTTYSFFNDSSLLGMSSAERMAAVGYAAPGTTLFANMAEDPVALYAAWRDNPSTRQILLDPNIRHIGIGFAASGFGPVPHVWLVDFGGGTDAAVPPDCDCCIGVRGNIDGDLDETISLTDLTVLVNALFVTFEPPFCVDEANVNADPAGELSLSDLTVMVNHLFVTFAPMPPCPAGAIALTR